MTAVLLFAATFAVVFFLSLQQLNIERDRRAAAFATSMLIGLSNLALFKVLPGHTTPIQLAAYLLGGACGVVTSMWAYPLLARLFTRKATP